MTYRRPTSSPYNWLTARQILLRRNLRYKHVYSPEGRPDCTLQDTQTVYKQMIYNIQCITS